MNNHPDYYVSRRLSVNTLTNSLCLRAFTLIEILISLSLASVLIYTMMAGFRVCAGVVTVANRMSLENSLMRAGFMRAENYLDFWTDIDDPDNTGDQHFRPVLTTPGADGQKGGLAFTPMSLVSPYTAGTTREKDVGWNDKDPWASHDPRAWFHGAPLQKCATDEVGGFYSIFANVSTASVTIRDGYRNVSYGDVQTPHSWWDAQIWSLHDAMGGYAFLDYVPTNTLFACHTPFVAGNDGDQYDPNSGKPTPIDCTTGDGVPYWFVRVNPYFCDGDGAQGYPYGRFRLTAGAAFPLRSPFIAQGVNNLGTVPSKIPVLDTAALVAENHRYFYNSYWWGVGTQDVANQFEVQTKFVHEQMEVRPSHWPSLTVNVSRFVRAGRFVNTFNVRWISPVTGQLSDMSFTSTATTLRGARMQRQHPEAGGGWATWNNDGSTTNDRTLDN